MSSLPIILGAAALFFVVSSKKTTSAKSSQLKEEDIKPPGDGSEKLDLKISPIQLPSTEKGKKSNICTDNEYLNNKNECASFWNDSTEDLVIDALQEEVYKLKNQSIEAICSDSEEFGKIIPNETPIKIARTVIKRLWPVLEKHTLPPKETDPKWIKTIWVRVINIYVREICGFDSKDPK